MLKFSLHNYQTNLRQVIFSRDIPSKLRLTKEHKQYVIDKTADDFCKFKIGTPYISFADFGNDEDNYKHSFFNLLNLDKPFLFDSIMNIVQEMGLLMVMTAHPVVYCRQMADKSLGEMSIEKNNRKDIVAVSLIHVQLLRQIDEQQKTQLRQKITKAIHQVKRAVDDWQEMRQTLKKSRDELAVTSEDLIKKDVREESVEFLDWMLDDNFIFLGTRQFRISRIKSTSKIETIKDKALGILRDPDTTILRVDNKEVEITQEIRAFYESANPLIITKANTRSKIHRNVHMDYIGLKKYDKKGQVIGELRIAGLFTSVAYKSEVQNIPLLRHKYKRAFEYFDFDKTSHSGKLLSNIINDFPRDELFQTPSKQLNEHLQKIISLDVLPRLLIITRNDTFHRFVSVIVYVPKDRYSGQIEDKIIKLIVKYYNGRLSAKHVHHPEGYITRMHCIIGRNKEPLAKLSQEYLEAEVGHLLLNYNDLVCEKIFEAKMPNPAKLSRNYRHAFPLAYQDTYTIEQAIEDIKMIEQAIVQYGFATRFDQDQKQQIYMRICNKEQEITLSDRVPILENFGFEVVSEKVFDIKRYDKDEKIQKIVIHDMLLRYQGLDFLTDESLPQKLQECYTKISIGMSENDAYAKLLIKAKLNWHEIALFRSFGRYLKQAGGRFDQISIADTLCRHFDITEKLWQLFQLLFSPLCKKDSFGKNKKTILEKIERKLQNVTRIDDDIIIRRICQLILNITRTNFYQKKQNKQINEVISFKIAAQKLDFLPNPKPFAEIFICSPKIEGVHMRFGKIARGGIRWSDRYNDFRTEILGLVKAQQVKNAVIVPVGAKGGFVVKKIKHAKDKNQILKEGIETYKIFITSLLQITDNLVDNKVVPCVDVIRYDGDDPYLVVAADKGTAAFSDIANEISQQQGFWLGDAFASGGSYGYDHKKMGITAKGAWEAVKRHFREVNHDIQKQDFTVIGVGDMSGDVFGNGMLLSKKIKLIAAFDHRDIFFDPQPDTQNAYLERKRLFDSQKPLTWQDYNRKYLSKDADIFKRSAKFVKIKPAMAKILNIKNEHEFNIRPEQLIKKILQIPADLLWFGGIGTYVKDNDESDIEVGDHANNAVRINAEQLKVKIVGEGANLAMTHKARIKFAKNGGKINNDAVDNAAGVNCSDLEVNIKIAFGDENNDLNKYNQRNKLLVEMTEQVAELVLENNYKQTLGISVTMHNGVEYLPFQLALMRDLENEGRLNRQVEFLPSDSQIENLIAEGKKLTRPEISVIVAYAKIYIFDEIINTSIIKEKFTQQELLQYFPQKLQDKYKKQIFQHKLKNEIVATILANDIVNDCGPSFVKRMQDETQNSIENIVRAYIIAKKAFDIDLINNKIAQMDNKIDGQKQLEIYSDGRLFLDMIVSWILLNQNINLKIEQIIEFYCQIEKNASEQLKQKLHAINNSNLLHYYSKYEQLPEILKTNMLKLSQMTKICDVASIKQKYPKIDIKHIINTYVEVAESMSMINLINYTENHKVNGYFEKLATDKMAYLLRKQLRSMTIKALQQENAKKWIEINQNNIEWIRTRTRRAMADGKLSLAEIVTLSGNYEKLIF